MLQVHNFGMARKKAPPLKTREPNRVRELRTSLGWTQAKLAEKTGLSVPSISQIESGKQGFSDDSRVALAKALRCDPADLMPPDPDSLTAIFNKIKPEDQPLARNLLKQFIDR